jgi:hypothetical protein
VFLWLSIISPKWCISYLVIKPIMLHILLICSSLMLFGSMACLILLSQIVMLNFWRTLWNKLCTKLLFSTTCHPQTDGQMEVVNRTLSTMLWAVLNTNLKLWEECLLQVEFVYNRAAHSITKFSLFQLVYGFNPCAPINLIPLPPSAFVNLDDSQRADFIQKLHETTKQNNEKMNEKYRIIGSKGWKEIKLEPGDLVWLHMRKDHFPELRKSKLMSRAAGPFKVLEKINDNTYRLELPADFGVSPTFNISNLCLYLGEEDEMPPRMTPIQEGEDDGDIPTHDDSPIAIQRPITRACARQLQYHVKSFFSSTPCQLQDRLLPNEILIVRNEGQAYEGLKNQLGGAQGRGKGAGQETGPA